MPFLKSKIGENLVSQGIQYQILFSFKQDSLKKIFKAIRKDKQTGVQQEVLLKIFLKERESYREEFESLSHVFSPYCVRLFGFENFGGKRALVLEYIKGVSLFQLVERFTLSSQEIQHILISVYKGLEDLNKQGLCHGDLSLNNILIDEKAHIKLIDFGKANYDQGVQGTPPFIAPELFQGARASFLSDLYSLGVIEAVLKTPYPLSSLQDIHPEDFNSNSPLLSLDPGKRFFTCATEDKSPKPLDIKPLSYKVKDILSFMESRRCSTLKKSVNNSPFFVFAKGTFIFMILFIMGWASFQQDQFSQGVIKIYTNEWFVIRIGEFKSYTPVTIPLKTGWHFIEWENRQSQGKKQIFISKGKSLFLNDKSFLH